MFCSTIIPTINRDTLSKSVYSVLNQEFNHDDFEIIVVNDSGQPLPPAEWQQSERVRVITTNRREKSVARNTGAAIARGKYLHFLDDDDWILPGTLESFWSLANNNDTAVWLYGAAQLVDVINNVELKLYLGRNGNCFIPAMSGEWIPIQVSLIQTSAFFAVGGFNHLMVEGEDKELCQRIARYGTFACTPKTIAGIIRDEVRTKGYPLGVQQALQEREKILNETGTFTYMRASADSSYWHGRVTRTYLVSAVWNLRHHRVLTAVSRALSGLGSTILSIQHLFLSGFWKAVMTSHNSRIISE